MLFQLTACNKNLLQHNAVSEDAMKTTTILTAALFLVSIPAIGQSDLPGKQLDGPYVVSEFSYTDAYLQRAFRNYAMDLNSANDGVVESTIAYLTFLHLSMPQVDLKRFEAMITKLAELGRTPVIRYKAYLATMVFESPGSFAGVQNAGYANSNQFLYNVASQAQMTLLGQNIK